MWRTNAAATGRHPLANPVLVAVVFVALVLAFTDTPYPTYFEGAQFVHFLLGPATVVLAFPLYERRATVMRALVPMLAALAAGSVMTLVCVIVLARLFSVPQPILVSLAPKDEQVRVLGPAEAPIAVVRGRHRYRLLVKSPRAYDLSGYLRDWLAVAPKTKGNLQLEVDVDPMSFF